MASLQKTSAVKVFRFVDDFPVSHWTNQTDQQSSVESFNVLHSKMKRLVLTSELPSDNKLRLLDMELNFRLDHVCWHY